MTTAAPELTPPDQILEFAIGEQRYCVSIDAVEEIVRANELTSVPDSPPQVAGITNLRGQTTTVLYLRRIFDLQTSGDSQQVVIIEGEERIGWLVDRVREVSSLRDVDVDSVDDSPYVSGVINDDGFIIWVEPETVNGSVSTDQN